LETGTAMATLIRQLDQAHFVEREDAADNLYSLLFRRPSGEEIRVMWALAPMDVDLTGATGAVDVSGNPVRLAGSMKIGDSPVFVTGPVDRLPSAEAPMLKLIPFEVGQTITLGERRIEVLPAEHTVPAVGFAVLGAPVAKRGAFIFTGDTGPNPGLWTRLHGMRIAALVIETAFSDEERQLARVSRHLCPSVLGQELARLEHPTNVYVTHIKPGEVDAVMSEIAALNSPHRVRALTQGQVIAID